MITFAGKVVTNIKIDSNVEYSESKLNCKVINYKL